MAKDPTAYLRRESRAAHKPRQEVRDARTVKMAIEYMKSRGLFDAWKDERVEFRPVVEGLPWNPEAPPRIVAFRVTEHVMGHWQNGQSRVRSPRGKHYIKGTWVSEHDAEIARVPVPHWDYDGNDGAAREAWECAETHRWLDAAADRRAYDQDHSWEIGHEAHNMECLQQMVDEGSEGCAWPTMWREAA